MKSILQRAAALVLVAALIFTVSACAAYADLVNGFVDAAAYMRDEANVRSETSVTLRFSDEAEPVSFPQFVSLVLKAVEAEDKAFLEGIEIGLSLTSEVYEDNSAFSVGWIGENGVVEPLITLIAVDGVFYVSTDLLWYIFEIDELARYGLLAMSFEYVDYIRVDSEYIMEMMATAQSEFDMDMPEIPDIPEQLIETIHSAAEALVNTILEYTPSVMPDDILIKEKDSYILSLDAESAMMLLSEVLSIATENESEIKDFFNEVLEAIANEMGEDYHMPDDVLFGLADVDFKEVADAYGEAVMGVEIGRDVPDFGLTISVSGTGRGADKKQTTVMSFAIPEFKNGVLDTLNLEISCVTTVAKDPITIPAGEKISLERVFTMLEMYSAGFNR